MASRPLPYFASVFACSGGGGAGRSELALLLPGAPVAAVAVPAVLDAEQRARATAPRHPDAAWRGPAGGWAKRVSEGAARATGRRPVRKEAGAAGQPGRKPAGCRCLTRAAAGVGENETGQGRLRTREISFAITVTQERPENYEGSGGGRSGYPGLEKGKARAIPGPGSAGLQDLRAKFGTRDYRGGEGGGERPQNS